MFVLLIIHHLMNVMLHNANICHSQLELRKKPCKLICKTGSMTPKNLIMIMLSL